MRKIILITLSFLLVASLLTGCSSPQSISTASAEPTASETAGSSELSATESQEADVSASGISDEDYKIYHEVMDYLNESYNTPVDVVFEKLAPRYGMTAEELKEFMNEHMEAAIQRDLSGNPTQASDKNNDVPFQKVVKEELKQQYGDLLNQLITLQGKKVLEGKLSADETKEYDALLGQYVDLCDEIAMSIFRQANSEGRSFANDETAVLADMYQSEVDYTALISTVKSKSDAFDLLMERHFANMKVIGDEAGISDKTAAELTEAEKIISNNNNTINSILSKVDFAN